MAGNNDGESNRNKINRRHFLGSVTGSIGLGGILGVHSASATSFVSVPEYVSLDGVESWMQVPKKWNQHLKHVERVKEAFEKRNLNKEHVSGVSITSFRKNIWWKERCSNKFVCEEGVPPPNRF